MLMKHGMVSIHQLGLFSLQKTSAEFIESGTRLTPPTTRLVYTAAENVAYSLCTLLMEEGEAPDAASSAENTLSQWFVLLRERGEEALLPGFGRFTTEEFVPLSSEWFNAYHGMQIVEVPKVSLQTAEAKLVAPEPDPSQFVAKPFWKSSFFWISAVIILFLVVLAVFLMPHAPTDSSMPEPVRKTRIIDTRDSLTGDAAAGKTDSYGQSLSANQSSTDASSLQCTIIVGAFKQGDNAEKMKQKILKEGYPIFEEKHNGLTRVGVILECDQQEPEIAKAAARKFNQEAWLLRHE